MEEEVNKILEDIFGKKGKSYPIEKVTKEETALVEDLYSAVGRFTAATGQKINEIKIKIGKNVSITYK